MLSSLLITLYIFIRTQVSKKRQIRYLKFGNGNGLIIKRMRISFSRSILSNFLQENILKPEELDYSWYMMEYVWEKYQMIKYKFSKR